MSVLISYLLVFLFFLCVTFFGLTITKKFSYQLSQTEKLSSSFIIGIFSYTFITNILASVTNTKFSVWTTFLVLTSIGIYELRQYKNRFNYEIIQNFVKNNKFQLGIAATISLLSWLVALREFGPDHQGHVLLSSTIVHDNIPFFNPVNPDTLLGYHYGPDLLVAALHILTQIPLAYGFDSLLLIFSGSIFLTAFNLYERLTLNKSAATFAAFFFFYGGGILFLHFTEGIPIILKYLNQESLPAGSWKFLSSMLLPEVNRFLVYGINNYSGAMGTPLFLYLCNIFILQENQKKTSPLEYFIISILFGHLALFQETTFVILFTAICFYLLKTIFTNGNKEKLIQVLAFYLSLPLAISITQGGIITVAVINKINNFYDFTFSPTQMSQDFGASGEHEFGINTIFPLIQTDVIGKKFMNVLGQDFLLEIGVVLFIMPFAIHYFRRNNKLLFLTAVGITVWFIPILIFYKTRPWELLRLYSFSTPILSATAGSFLYLSAKKNVNNRLSNYYIHVLMFLLCCGGLSLQLILILTPWHHFGNLNAPFIGNFPVLSSEESSLYQWIKDNTKPKSRFFPYSPRLIAETGRMSPGDYIAFFPKSLIPVYQAINTKCDIASIEKLGINYVIIGDGFFSKNAFINLCDYTVFKRVYISDTEKTELYQVLHR